VRVSDGIPLLGSDLEPGERLLKAARWFFILFGVFLVSLLVWQARPLDGLSHVGIQRDAESSAPPTTLNGADRASSQRIDPAPQALMSEPRREQDLIRLVADWPEGFTPPDKATLTLTTPGPQPDIELELAPSGSWSVAKAAIPRGALLSLECDGAFVRPRTWLSPPFSPEAVIQIQAYGRLEVFVEGYPELGPVHLGLTAGNTIRWSDSQFEGRRAESPVTNGHFVFGGLIPGKHQLTLVRSSEARELVPETISTRFVQVPPQGMITVLMDPHDLGWVQVHGRVLHKGKSVAGAKITFDCCSVTEHVASPSVHSDADGRYSVGLPELGTFPVSLEWKGGRTTSTLVVDKAPFEHDFLIPAGRIHGVAEDFPKGVSVYLRKANEVPGKLAGTHGGPSTVTDEGRFEFLGVPFGTYTISSGLLERVEGLVLHAHLQLVTISEPKPEAEVALRRRPGEEFLCRVRSSDGLPLAHARVFGRAAANESDTWRILGSTNEQGELTASFGSGLGLTIYAERHIPADQGPGWAAGPLVIAKEGESIPPQWDLVCQPYCRMSVTLKDASGQDGAPFSASFFTEDCGRVPMSDPYPAIGSKHTIIPPLAPGPYTIVVFSLDGVRYQRDIILSPGEVRHVSMGE